MNPFEYRQFYRRNRPHIHSPGSTLFVTFRLVDSVPQSILRQYRNDRALRENQINRLISSAEVDLARLEFQRKWFAEFDRIMDKGSNGPMWLGREDVRAIVRAKLLADDVSKYQLDAFSIMSNHVHVVFQPNLNERNLVETKIEDRTAFESESPTLAEIMQSVKGVTSRECNKLLNRKGQFWEHESFDHEVRGDAGFLRCVKYTLNNPVKAGLVRRPMDWPGNFLADRLRDRVELEDLF